jgi:hypothetical protein
MLFAFRLPAYCLDSIVDESHSQSSAPSSSPPLKAITDKNGYFYDGIGHSRRNP